jgi:hypothetical protein
MAEIDVQSEESCNLNKNTNITRINNSTIQEKLVNYESERELTITLLLAKKIQVKRGSSTVFKTLLSDGLEYLEITEWNSNSFENYEENSCLKFTNYYLKTAPSTNAYFIKMNIKDYTLIKQNNSLLQLSNEHISVPPSQNIEIILNLTGNIYKNDIIQFCNLVFIKFFF